MTGAPVIPIIIDRHAEDAAFLWLQRDAAVRAPNYDLDDLAELDNRLDAHLDGLRVAGEAGWEVCRAALDIGEPGEVFTAAYLAMESGDGRKIDPVVTVAGNSVENMRAFVSAMGWPDFSRVEPLAAAFCNANQPVYNYMGLAAFAINRVDPGPVLERFLASDNSLLRARSLKAVGELGRGDLLAALREHWESENEACRFFSIWSAVLLGERNVASLLRPFVNGASAYAESALSLAVRATDNETTRNWLSGLAQDESTRRYALLGAGYSGDPLYIPSLQNQMAVPEFARVSGEAFAMITGTDLAYLDLDTDQPEGFEAGPTEDPEDENVDLDSDEDLPWPDPGAVDQWWTNNQGRFVAGERYLCGERISPGQCRTVLKSGFQRQRQAAALELALASGEGGFYETRSPGFRQKAVWSGQ